MKDSGSQSNLVDERVLTPTNHKILETVELDLSGINASKLYRTKLVEMELRIGDSFRTIEAIAMPTLNINLTLPGLSQIVRGFMEKGYEIADLKLLEFKDYIEDIDLLLGTEVSYCFLEEMVPFGPENKSTFSLSNLGVMFYGKTEQTLRDLKDLIPFQKLHTSSVRLKTSVNFVSSRKGVKFNSCTLSSGSNFEINVQSSESFNQELISKAVSETLEQECCRHLHKDDIVENEDSEINQKLVDYALDNTKRNDDGRLIMPLLWNGRASHLLANNMNLAKTILDSNKRKLVRNDQLGLVHNAIKEQVDMWFIEKIPNLENYIEEHQDCSFLAHMPIVKLSRETTKCRVVFLSNLCEKGSKLSKGVSHNQAMFSGPCLNQKLVTSLLLLRFDSKVLAFDLKKAFLQIALSESDQSKLLFFGLRIR